jgi:ATP-dependent 26S proteasome regulatory subunit
MLKAIRGNLTKAFRSIFILSHTPDVPPELEGYCEFIRYQLPDRAWVRNLVTSSARTRISGGKSKEIPPIELNSREIDAVAQELMGLTSMEIDEALATANRRNASRYAQNQSSRREFDMSVIREIKATAIERSGTLSITVPPGGLELVGGMNILKNELQHVKADLTPESRADGIPAPKGFLMVGPGGTGKTLITKCIGSLLDMQVVSLDIGACKGSFVGQSEGNLRAALDTANRISPCLLFVDEFEKMWGGALSGSLDGGTTSNMLQTWLRWMQDLKDDGVIVIAACNEVRGLPGPVIRAGRFDDIIYVDLPGPKSREEITKIHLNKRGWDADAILSQDNVWAQLLALTRGFSGAEIERMVVKALRFKRARLGYGRDKLPGLVDFREAVSKVTPISRTHRQELLSLATWASRVNVIKASDEELDFSLTSDSTAVQSTLADDPSGEQREIDMGDGAY